jgi:prevent-host-death family protein
MTTLSTTQLAQEVEKAISMVTNDHEQVIITEDGQQVAALVSIEDLDLIRRLEDEADLRAVEEAKAEGLNPIPLEEFRKELGL